jgi:peptidoglycan/LPS O-acetylase OafA/YrhL
MLPLHLYQGLGHLGVAIFFLISGYIISMSAEKDDRISFFVKRILRIFPALIFAVVLTGLLGWLLNSYGYMSMPGSQVSSLREIIGAAFLYDQIFIGKNVVLTTTWTLLLEVIFYTLVAVLYTTFKIRPATSILIMIFLPFAAAQLQAELGLPSLLVIYLPYISLFTIGRATYLLNTNRIDLGQFAVLTALTIMIYIQLSEFVNPGYLFTKTETIPAYTYLQAMLIFWGALLSKPWDSKVLSFLADISYSLYLLHIPVGMFTLILLHEVVPYELSLLLAVSLSIFASYLSWKYIEKPSQNIARRILPKRRSL